MNIPIASDIFSTTFEHNLATNGHVEMVPVNFLRSLANPDAGDETDLGHSKARLVPLNVLWEDILLNGMRDPLELSADRKGNSRLESGNHRIKLFHRRGIRFVPATVIISDFAIRHRANGSHNFNKKKLIMEVFKGEVEGVVYKRPSEVFYDLRQMLLARNI